MFMFVVSERLAEHSVPFGHCASDVHALPTCADALPAGMHD